MKKIIRLIACILVTLLIGSVLVACTDPENPDNGGGVTLNPPGTYSVKVAELKDSSETQPRWLSIPNSRLVLNYYDYGSYVWGSFDNPTELEYSSDVTIPLNIGYLNPFRASRLPEQVLLYSANGDEIVEADSYTSAWRADRIEFTATSGAHNFAGYDYFYDESTIVRNIESNNGSILVAGPYSGGAEVIDNAIVSRTNAYVTAVAVEDADFQFYSSYDNMMENYQPSDTPSSSNGWWSCIVSVEKSSIVVTVNNVDVSEDDASSKTIAPLQHDNARVQAANREDEWNKLFAKVPAPTNFSFEEGFESMGITAEQVKNKYYQAYAQIISNVLPENSETNFPYHQIATGKGSLWEAGAEESIYSAQWESLYAAGFLSFVMPEEAWSTVLGFLSLVDENGWIGGETLPTNKVQAVWMCYSALSNKEYLAQCVEPLEKYLDWGLDNPRWVHGAAHNVPAERDIDYCSNLLIDITFMQKIYNELGQPEKAAEWGEIADKYYEDTVTTWFFPENMDVPVQYYFVDTNAYKVGSHLRITKILNTTQLDGEYLQKTKNLVDSFYDTSKRFMGFDYVKFDQMQYTIYGFIRQGYTEMAANCVQATLRDICEAGMLGEEYRGWMRTADDGTEYESVFCQGVRPSMFGAELVIDNVWLLNGFYYHEGGLHMVSLFENAGGLKNVTFNGVSYDLSINGTQAKINDTTVDLQYGKVTEVTVD